MRRFELERRAKGRKKPSAWLNGRGRMEYRRQVHAILDEFKSRGCLRPGCGEKDPCCLGAHHRDPAKKSFGISRAIVELRISPERLKVELEKCECWCFNCHAKYHAGHFSLDDLGIGRAA